jgi:hypothetical protein
MRPIFAWSIAFATCTIHIGDSNDSVVLVAAVASRIDPKILSPNTATVWEVGHRFNISWNPDYRLKNGEYYNAFTRVTIELYQHRPLRGDLLLFRIAENYPFSLGKIYWTVPLNVTLPSESGDKWTKIWPFSSSDEKTFYIMVYPSYFDWDRECRNCKSKAPIGERFSIQPLCTLIIRSFLL